MKWAGNRNCLITLRLSGCESGKLPHYLGESIASIGVVKEGYKTRDYDVAHVKLVKQVKPL